LAWSATYYVKTGGNDEAAGTSDELAWATIAKVEATATSGDTVYFRSQDTWTSATTPTLAATPGVTYDGSTYGSGTRATITTTYSGAPGPGVLNYCIVQIEVSNVTFKGFNVDVNHARLGGLYIGNLASDDIYNTTVDNCEVQNTGGESGDWNYGILVSSKTSHTVHNTTITNCIVHHTFHEGIAVYASWNTYGNKNDTVLIRGCKLYDIGTYAEGSGAGIAINNDSDNVTVEFCDIRDSSGYGIDIRVSPSWEGEGNVLSAPNNMVIRYNIIRNNLIYGIQIRNPRSFAVTGAFYGNIFFENGKANTSNSGADFHIVTDPSWTYPDSVFNIYNNTFYSVSNPNTNMRAVVAIGYFGGSLEGLTVNFKNNIVYSGNYWPLISNKGATLNHSNNLIYRSSDAGDTHVYYNGTAYDRAGVKTWDNTAQNTDPAFSGGTPPTGFSGTYGTNMVPNTDYFQLTVDSPAKDTGATLEGYTGSINGAGLTIPIVRPLGSAFDIGAYEYGTVAQSGGSAGSGIKMQGVTIR
jgi:hypothetical protein